MAHKSVSLIKVHAPADTTAALIYNKHSVGCSERTNAPKEFLTLALRWQLSKGPPNGKRKFSSKQKPLDMSGHKNACRWLAAMQIKIKCKVGKRQKLAKCTEDA